MVTDSLAEALLAVSRTRIFCIAVGRLADHGVCFGLFVVHMSAVIIDGKVAQSV